MSALNLSKALLSLPFEPGFPVAVPCALVTVTESVEDVFEDVFEADEDVEFDGGIVATMLVCVNVADGTFPAVWSVAE